jgi:hypothetical protein
LKIPRRSCEVFPLSEMVNFFSLKGKKNKLYACVAKVYGKNEFPVHEIVKEKEMYASFSLSPITAKGTFKRYCKY